MFTVLPATLPEYELERRLADADAAVVMKIGRNLPKVRRALDRAGRLDRAIYVERGTMANALIDEARRQARYAGPLFRHRAGAGLGGTAVSGSLAIIGLGPGGDCYLTREAEETLEGAEALYGYGPYLDRVPMRAGQARHPSDNREESARAKAALSHAAQGAHVGIVVGWRPRRVRHGGLGLRGDRCRAGKLARTRYQGRSRHHRHARGRCARWRSARP